MTSLILSHIKTFTSVSCLQLFLSCNIKISIFYSIQNFLPPWFVSPSAPDLEATSMEGSLGEKVTILLVFGHFCIGLGLGEKEESTVLHD